MGEVVSIVMRPLGASLAEEGYTRVAHPQALLVAGYGIEGDAKGGSAARHLNLMSAGALQQLSLEGFQTAPGQLGEQIILGGLEIDTLPCGTRLQIGAQACIELTEPRTGCAKFERHQS